MAFGAVAGFRRCAQVTKPARRLCEPYGVRVEAGSCTGLLDEGADAFGVQGPAGGPVTFDDAPQGRPVGDVGVFPPAGDDCDRAVLRVAGGGEAPRAAAPYLAGPLDSQEGGPSSRMRCEVCISMS
jgi:hypothetical protein